MGRYIHPGSCPQPGLMLVKEMMRVPVLMCLCAVEMAMFMDEVCPEQQVLISQDVREDHRLLPIGDEAHGHTCNGIPDWNARIHQRQGPPTDARHR